MLTGNPCISEASGIESFKEMHPKIRLVIDYSATNIKIVAGNSERRTGTALGEESDPADLSNADSVLRELVSRKCLLQSIEPHDYKASIQVSPIALFPSHIYGDPQALGDEIDDAVRSFSHRTRKTVARSAVGLGLESEEADNMNQLYSPHSERMKSIIEHHKNAGVSDRKFMENLRADTEIAMKTKYQSNAASLS